MSDQHDGKGMLNEVLPDPNRAAAELAEGTPRGRTADHLKRILAAGLALQLSADMAGCAGPPSPAPPKAPEVAKGRPPDPPSAPPRSASDGPPRPRQLWEHSPGYGVVDMLPPPVLAPAPGFLSLTSTPTARITIDGRPTGLDTPQHNMPLSPGKHRIRLEVPGEALSQEFSVEVVSRVTITEVRDLRATTTTIPKD